MAIREEAQRNHDALFPNHASTLKVTDPELIELFDNWAFDEVLKDGILDTRTRLMVQLAATIGCQAVSEYRIMLVRASCCRHAGGGEGNRLSGGALRRMAKVFDFLHVTNEVLRSRGVSYHFRDSPRRIPAPGSRRASRSRNRSSAIGLTSSTPNRLRMSCTSKKHLSANCFGDYYTRTGLDLKTRELLTFSMLASLGGCEPQLLGHVAANLSVGNDRGCSSARSRTCCLHRLSPHPQRDPSHQRRDDTMTNVLILGANGQLARHTTRVFLRDTDAKLTLYLASRQSIEHPDPARVTILEGDVLDLPTSRRP